MQKKNEREEELQHKRKEKIKKTAEWEAAKAEKEAAKQAARLKREAAKLCFWWETKITRETGSWIKKARVIWIQGCTQIFVVKDLRLNMHIT